MAEINETELAELRAAYAHCRAHHTRSAVNGKKRAGRERSKLTKTQRTALYRAAVRYKAAWYKAGRPELIEWLPQQIATLPDDVQAARMLAEWQKLAAKWN